MFQLKFIFKYFDLCFNDVPRRNLTEYRSVSKKRQLDNFILYLILFFNALFLDKLCSKPNQARPKDARKSSIASVILVLNLVKFAGSSLYWLLSTTTKSVMNMISENLINPHRFAWREKYLYPHSLA